MTALQRFGRSLREGESVLILLLVAIGLYWMADSLRIGLWDNGRPQSGLMPFFYGALLAVFSLVVLIGVFRGQDEEEPLQPARKPLMLIGLLIVTVLGFPVIGAVLSLFLMMTIIFTVIEGQAPIRSLIVAGVTSATLYFVFDFWLAVNLPQGPWGF